MKSVSFYQHETTDIETTSVKLVEIAWQRIPSGEFPPAPEMQKLIAKRAVEQAVELDKQLEKVREEDDD